MKEEYEQYAGDADKLKALFQKGLDELGITDKPEDITITLLSQGSATENQLEREYLQQSISQNLGVKVELNTVGDYQMFANERDNQELRYLCRRMVQRLQRSAGFPEHHEDRRL